MFTMVLQEDVGTQTEEESLNLKRKAVEPEQVKTKIIIVKSDKDGINNLNNTLEVDIKCNKCSQDFNRIALFIAHMKENCVNCPESAPEHEKQEKDNTSVPPPPKKRILILKKRLLPPPLQQPKQKQKKKRLRTVTSNNSDSDEVQILDQVENRKRIDRLPRNKVMRKSLSFSLSCPHCNQDGFKSQKELDNHFEKNWKIMSCLYPGCKFECTYICEMQLHSRSHRRNQVAATIKFRQQLKSQVQENINGLNMDMNMNSSSSSSIILPTGIPMSIPFGLPFVQMPLQIPAPDLGQNQILSLPQPLITTSQPGGENEMTVDEITQKVAMEYFNLLFCTPDSNPVDGQSSSLNPVQGQSIYYSCKECSKCFVQSTELGLHLTKSDNPCPFPGCECFYDLPCSLDLHLQLHEPIPVHLCPQQETGNCDKSFITLAALLHHRVSQHGEDLDLTQTDQLLSSNVLTEAEKKRRREVTKSKTYSCPLCPQEQQQQTPFSHLITLENHKKKEHVQNNNNDESSSAAADAGSKNNPVEVGNEDEPINQHPNPNNNEKDKEQNKTKNKEKKCREKIFKCPVDGCHQKFSMIRYIKVHAKTHKNIESTTVDQVQLCTICGRSFKSKVLTTHMKTHEENRVLFECEYPGCGKSFTNQRSLQTHNYEHTNEFPFLCSNCGAGYKSKSRLRVHELSHMEKKFKCDFPDCEYKTADKMMLKKHNQKHANEKNHMCQICGAAFNFASTLYRHKFVHMKDKKPKQRSKLNRSSNQLQFPVSTSNAQEFQHQQEEYYDVDDDEEEEESEMEYDD